VGKHRAMPKEILCTLGPASMNDRVIYRLEELGVSLFRINLSHIKLDELANTIEFVRSRTQVPICLDTEGAQIRTGALREETIEVQDNALLRIYRQPVPGDIQSLNLYPNAIVDSLMMGDLISIDFHATLAQVIDIEPGCAVLRVLNGGTFGANKAVTVDRTIELPALTKKDRAALKLGITYDIDRVALSFANRGSDVDQIRALAGPNATVIAKIECRNGLTNLDAIAEKADALLIDRGDLSREIPIEQIPALQKMITARAKHHKRKVYVATNLLESMVKDPTPTRAEINDVFNTLLDGADGLVLAAETAIGAHPIGCANMIVKLVQEFEQRENRTVQFNSRLGTNAASLLVEPHGGELINCQRPTPGKDELASLQRINVSEKALMDCEQIALGTFSPIRGFMDRENLESVLDRHRLADNIVWTMPILLPIKTKNPANLRTTETIVLTDSEGTPSALIEDAHAYQMDLEDLAERWYGTRSPDHPGVVQCDRLSSLHRHYELTPAQARYIFTYKGWSRVVAFHTRNVMHRAHEHIALSALKTSMADGLLLSPLTGPTKRGDFLVGPIVKSYQTMLESGLLPFDQAILGSLMTYPRYAGPREAVFAALCRKNMGCSHFIVGRDHAGVGGFYSNEMTRESNRADLKKISGTEARNAIRENRPLPDWYMRQLIQDQLRADIAAGKPVFNNITQDDGNPTRSRL